MRGLQKRQVKLKIVQQIWYT